jgi:hypothetical protein
MKLQEIGTNDLNQPVYRLTKVKLNIGNNPSDEALYRALYEAGVLEVIGKLPDSDIEIQWAHKYSNMTGLMRDTWDTAELYSILSKYEE